MLNKLNYPFTKLCYILHVPSYMTNIQYRITVCNPFSKQCQTYSVQPILKLCQTYSVQPFCTKTVPGLQCTTHLQNCAIPFTCPLIWLTFNTEWQCATHFKNISKLTVYNPFAIKLCQTYSVQPICKTVPYPSRVLLYGWHWIL
jgi:hypothetical protein